MTTQAAERAAARQAEAEQREAEWIARHLAEAPELSPERMRLIARLWQGFGQHDQQHRTA